MKKGFVSILMLFMLGLVSCDDGKIYDTTQVAEREGSIYKLTATVKGISGWADKYDVAVAAFGDTEFAVTSKIISHSIKDGATIDIVLAGVPAEVQTIEFCVINQLRKRVISLFEVEHTEQKDTVYVNTGVIDASMFNAVQKTVFDSDCVGCHGASTSAAGGLFLTEGQSYSALVNTMASLSPEGKVLVKPGDLDNSFIIDVLNTTDAVRHDHNDILSGKPDKMNLLKNWILNGAQK